MSRIRRVGEQVRRVIAEALRTRVRDPRVVGVVVTGAEVTADLSLARVFVQLSAAPHERQQERAGLEAVTPFLRGILAKEMPVRRVPELRFVHDQTLQSAQRIEDLLRDVLPEDDTDPSEPGEPSHEGSRDG